MCFSPEADLCTGLVVGVVGIDALRHVQRPQQVILAATPLLLSGHEIDEAVVWWGLRGQLPWGVTHVAIYVFLTVAFALSFLVPLAMLGVEQVVRRRRLMAALLAVGVVTTIFLLAFIIRGPVGASVSGYHIVYSADISYGLLLAVLYVLVTCGSLLVGSSRPLQAFGLLNVAAAIGVGWLTFTGLTSLWCAWAALTSVAIAVYMRRAGPTLTPALAALPIPRTPL